MLITTQVHPFDLTGVIRQILEETDLSDPTAITRELITRIPPEALRDVLETVMPAYVRNRISAERAVTSPAAARRMMVRSSKVGGINEWWRRALDDRVAVRGDYKRLGDCTRRDLDYLAENLRERAEAMTRKAQRYEALRDKLPADRPETIVSDLPIPVLREWIGTFPDGTDRVED